MLTVDKFCTCHAQSIIIITKCDDAKRSQSPYKPVWHLVCWTPSDFITDSCPAYNHGIKQYDIQFHRFGAQLSVACVAYHYYRKNGLSQTSRVISLFNSDITALGKFP
jgi:hypothetical protein